KVISGGDNPYDIHDAKLSSSATAHESSSVTAHEISNTYPLNVLVIMLQIFLHMISSGIFVFCALNTSLCGLSRICVFVLSISPTIFVSFPHETVLLA
ncbi:hypothetical protein ACTQ28_09590, partial [Bacillota bacterium LCP21S3_A4]